MAREKFFVKLQVNVMNKNYAKKVVMDHLVTPYLEKKPEYIGTEIETVFFSLKGEKNNKEVMCKAFDYMIEHYGFHKAIVGTDGYAVRIENGKDSISADYSYEVLEFSMGKSRNIHEIQERFHSYAKPLTIFLKEKGYLFTGMGSNLFHKEFEDDSQYTHDPFYNKVREYVLTYTTHKDPSSFYTLMASTQSHLDIEGKELLKTYNLFQKLEFVRGILFSNSIPNLSAMHKSISCPENLLCARDLIWDTQGLPNTGVVEHDFVNIEELVEHYTHLKLFIRASENGLEIFEPISLQTYFEDETKLSEGLATFRSFEHVVLNNYHALEVRSDCTQPLLDAFAPLAFNLGISEMADSAMEAVNTFLQENQIQKNNAQLRYMVITDQPIVEDSIMKNFLMQIYEISKAGLENRNLGEEVYIACLKERIESGLYSPAKRMKMMMAEGKTTREIAELYAKIEA